MRTLSGLFYLLLLVLSCYSISQSSIKIPVQLASTYHNSISVDDYLISEKYDGVRAIWTGEKLVSRSGKVISAPKWFVKDLPKVWLDGELWSSRGDFEFIASTVSKNKPIDVQWKKIKFMVFDAPDHVQPFMARVKNYHQIISHINQPHVIAIKQFKVADNKSLTSLLAKYQSEGAEGLMLHREDAFFRSGRSINLVKLKPYMDAEAQVIAHLPGKGKYVGKLGALAVRTEQGINFKIGSGFTDKQRQFPPDIGDVITFKYHGLTKNGIPKFASFLRIRKKAK